MKIVVNVLGTFFGNLSVRSLNVVGQEANLAPRLRRSASAMHMSSESGGWMRARRHDRVATPVARGQQVHVVRRALAVVFVPWPALGPTSRPALLPPGRQRTNPSDVVGCSRDVLWGCPTEPLGFCHLVARLFEGAAFGSTVLQYHLPERIRGLHPGHVSPGAHASG